MKRTTYILIGLFVAGFCMLVGGMFVWGNHTFPIK